MTTEKVKRKLTAILSADVKGYSRLMGADEVGTIRLLQTYRGVMRDLIQKKGGRVVDSPGDNVLAEFASVVDALESAVEIQRELKVRNADRSESRRMEFRIGINLGDVVEEGERIYGDGVNIAARIEGLAEGGGICISGTAFDQIGKRLPLGYEYMGEPEVKNIEKPVRVYRVLMEPEQAGKVIGEKGPKRAQWRWFAAAVAVLVLVAGGLVWNFYWHEPKIEPASKDKMAFPLPESPSIAVLPFDNMSGDPKQEFFSDGITETIITALSRVPKLFVIARNSTFTYKGKPVKVNQVSEELGVRYVLEGSVQRSADRIRVTAQLIDALTGQHIWAERYDRDLKDIFAIQDEITIRIITSLEGKLTGGGTIRVQASGTNNLEAYLLCLQANEQIIRLNKDGNLLAKQLAEKAIALDPKYPDPYHLLGRASWLEVPLGLTKDPRKSVADAMEFTKKALALDSSLAPAHGTLGMLYTLMRRHDEGIAECEKAVELEPNSAGAYYGLGEILRYAGRHEEAISMAKKAIRLNPFPPSWFYFGLTNAYSLTGQYQEAITAGKKAIHIDPNNLVSRVFLAAAYSLNGQEEEARGEAKEVLRINPHFSVDQWEKTIPYKNEEDRKLIIGALRKAGLPDKPPLPLPDKPSIAVLPFVNMSDDKSQEYFSDGLTEEIITALSKTPKLFVIARNSTFVYKGKPVNVQQVSRELGVKYVLEGSIRRSGDQLRITVQLIDATTGNHLWAERYDREMKEVFAIQDEITMKITSALQVKLTEGESASILAKGTQSLDAYLKLLEGRELVRALNRDDNALARKKFEEAVALDPKSAVAYSLLGFTYVMDFAFGIDREESMRKTFACTQKALALDDSQPTVYTTMEFMYGFMRRHEEAIAAGEKAVRNSPGSAYAQFSLGRALNFACRDREALTHLEMAVRMDPIPPAIYYMHIGSAHLNLRNYEEAVSALKKALALTPRNEFARGCLIVAYVEMNRMEEARTEAQEYQKTIPGAKPTPPEDYRKRAPWKDEKVTERFIEAYRKLRS